MLFCRSINRDILLPVLTYNTSGLLVQALVLKSLYHAISGAPNDNFRKNICSEDDLRSRVFATFVVKFLACLPLLGFSNM